MTFNTKTLILLTSTVSAAFSSSVWADKAEIEINDNSAAIEMAAPVNADEVKARVQEHAAIMREHAENVKQQAQQTGTEMREQAQNMAQQRAGIMAHAEKPEVSRPEITRPEFAQRPEMPQRPVEFARPSFK